jgi:hypothetical protein
MPPIIAPALDRSSIVDPDAVVADDAITTPGPSE